MGLFEKSLEPVSRRPYGGRDGIALPTALFALVVVSVLAQGMWTITRLNNFSAVNREDAARALNLAEAGVAHTLGLLRSPLEATSLTNLLMGSDSAGGTGDDGLLIGYGLPGTDEIPAAGIAMEGGTYYVTLIDDAADLDGDPLTDSNSRILARCTGVTDYEGSASIDVVIGIPSFPAMASNGDLMINGNPDILGPCGGAHANNVVIVSGNPTVQTQISASDSVEVSGQINQAGGGGHPPRFITNPRWRSPCSMPWTTAMSPTSFCEPTATSSPWDRRETASTPPATRSTDGNGGVTTPWSGISAATRRSVEAIASRGIQ